MKWQHLNNLSPRSFVCGHCGADIASDKGYYADHEFGYVYICHKCTMPSFLDNRGNQVPGSIFGDSVRDITDQNVAQLYNEVRHCMASCSYTPAILGCRKLLMHIAVSKGAEAGKGFVYYVEYLGDKNFVAPDAKVWIDHIREKGNELNHEIVMASKQDAEELISFISMILKIIYEFPAMVKRRTAEP